MNIAYQTINHTADIGIRAFGKDLPEAFSHAAKGLFSLICDLRTVRGSHVFTIEVNAADQSELLVEWLNELLYRFDTESWILKGFTIKEMSHTALKAEVRGEKTNKLRHSLKRGIKSATYHMLKIEAGPAGYQIEVLLDI